MDRLPSLPVFLALGLLWTAIGPIAPALAGSPHVPQAAVDSAGGSFEKVVLEANVTDPMELQVAGDGRVFFVERGGAIRVWHPDSGATSTLGFVPVTNVVEDGLLGMALDPNFAENGWIYVYYSPASGESQHLSRFTLEEGRIDPASEEIVLRVPTQRTECCHSGGSVAFGPDGHLFLSTGDNTNPFRSSGYAPLDERPGQAAFDAQRSSANTDDLRGKILRIAPTADGGYTVPEGNLFPRDGSEGRPEIFVMGNRNPFRISIDPRTGWLYWGEVGPDAGAADPERGPAGHDELNQAREAGFYGWPYFIADNRAYHEYDWASGEAGPAFDPANPVNASVNSTGAEQLPAPREPLLWYPYGPSERFPELGAGGRCAMAGPVYYHDPETVAPTGLPARYDGVVFFYEWSRNWIKAVRLDEDGELAAIQPVAEDVSLTRPQDMELGPRGRLYVIEWGSNFGGENRDAQVVRLDYHPTSARPPVARIEASPASGRAPLSVRLDGSGSTVRTGEPSLSYRWDLDGDGVIDAEGARVAHTYEEAGVHEASLTVEDAAGRTGTATRTVVAGNTAPRILVETPASGGVYAPGDTIAYRVRVTDPEDGTIPADHVRVRPKLIFDSHARYLPERRGSSGTFVLPEEGLIVEEGPHLFERAAALEVRYEDEGAEAVPSLTGSARVRLQPRHREAEHWSSAEGVRRIGLDGAQAVLALEDGDHVSYRPIHVGGIASIGVRLSPAAGGDVELRLNGPNGPLLGRIDLPGAASRDGEGSTSADEDQEPDEEDGFDRPNPERWTWRTVIVPVGDRTGTHTVTAVARGAGDGTLVRLDHLRLNEPEE